KHYYRYLKGEKTSTNPMATIYAWSGALRKRGEMDGLSDLSAFGDMLETACLDTLGQGTMTGDLSGLVEPGFPVHVVDSEQFLDAIAARLSKLVHS
ncbi:MAG: NADP-dependent isocitrate dehydrogenase, partial [Oscillibacter sp.]|nr:NADP-dependent isocitrate dehydrogenase [Oscillibacter sp.]